ncbi:type II toxin-antitoxin system RelE/ParE family toxin [Sphingobacterium sp. Ka21]|uniref:Type II toxin-antitoxin system RelE/ParE family toxin n=2 Tax=Sphingobacterium pedocola TaxID=2082722 RepID=A0ABR9TAH4_9SPHI|nr:type II toxin-antitoxin system RelE/ParE family toxin [Sphingobacterium pedocola]
MAQSHLKQVFEHIGADSPQNALKVVTDITDTVEKAAEYPDAYAPDKLKLENDGTFRAFEKHHYRVSYRYAKGVLRVLRIRHTKMKPKYH